VKTLHQTPNLFSSNVNDISVVIFAGEKGDGRMFRVSYLTDRD